MRVPQLVRWPKVIKENSRYNALMSHEDWMSTLAAAAGIEDLVGEMKEGANYNNKDWRVHLDGNNFLPYFKGEVEKSPRTRKMYFSANGELNAVRWNEWKATFASMEGNMANAIREVSAWASLTNLHADPYETAAKESGMYVRWMIDNMWLFVPISNEVKDFVSTLDDYPMQEGAGFSASGINYNTLHMQKLIKQMETLSANNR